MYKNENRVREKREIGASGKKTLFLKIMIIFIFHSSMEMLCTLHAIKIS